MMQKMLLLLVLAFAGFDALWAQPWQVRHTGTMRTVKGGDYSAAVCLDSIAHSHLFALGPVAASGGELMVWNGRTWIAALQEESGLPMVHKDPASVCASFLVYAHVPSWDTIRLTTAPASLHELEKAVAG